MPDVVNSFDVIVEQLDGYRFKVAFDKAQHAEIVLDEPAPLGQDTAPNATRILAAAIGNCLSASLVFCARRQANTVLDGVKTVVHVEIVRNEQKRLRVGKVHVTIDPGPHGAAAANCAELFEDFCTVTQSVRDGLDIEVELAGRK